MYTLITAATTSMAYQLKSKLNLKDVILGDYLELPAVILKKGDMINLPDPASIAYTHAMLTLCLDKDIDTIYALRTEELANLNKANQLFNEYGIKIISEVNFEL